MKFFSGQRGSSASDPDRIPSAAELTRRLQRKMLLLASTMTVLFGLLYVAYFLHVGIWISTGRGVVAIAVALGLLAYGCRTRNYRAALNVLSVSLFVAFAGASYLQDGVFSPALWWMMTPPLLTVLSGSIRLGVAMFAAFVIHTLLLFWHGPGSWGGVSLMAVDRNLQMTLTVLFSTVFLGLFVGLGLHWIHQLQAVLERARETALEATAVKARFLSNMSHEIRTPLNGMIGATEMLRSRKMSRLQRRQLAAVQEQSAKMLLALVNDILDFSKLEAGKVVIERTHTRLRSLVFQANELFSVPAFERGIELTSSYDADVPEVVLGDATRLRQIVNNLVSNAVKFTQRGGVHIHLSRGHDSKNPQRAAGVHWMRIEVTDTGLGIETERIPALFQAFEQADGSVTRRYGGTGLGLSISHELAALMGGRIEVSSCVGVGSVFTLVVPLEAASAPPEPAEAPASAGRVMVVTHTRDLGRHVIARLDEIGVTALSSEELPGIEAAHRAGVTCVLVDAPLLKGDAADALLRLDELAMAGLRVAVLTPLAGDPLVEVTKHATLLYKPVRRARLREFIFGDAARNLRESHAAVCGLDSEFVDLETTPATDAERASGPRVLVVEDNPVNQIVAQAMLADLDATVLSASNGREALDLLEHTRVDLVLMDVQMPEMDGITATRLLRQRERATGVARTAVVAMTGNSESGDRQACLQAGMDAFLSKPFRLAQLRDIICAHSAG